MGLRGRLFAAVYDRLTAATEAAGLSAYRQQLLAGARGAVLEIGAGTGANLPFYGDAVTTLICAEPEEPMARRLAQRIARQTRQAHLVSAPAERLPLPDAHVDAVVSTLVLCTVPDQAPVLAEIRRVLKPGGRLLFLEHVRSEDPRVAAWQDRLNGLNRFIACGCNCNRATVAAIEAAGFTITTLRHEEIPKAPPFVRPLVIGAAQA